MSNSKTIYTIGHSTRTIDEFLSLLNESDIELVADIRSYPSSRKFPQFNADELCKSLSENGIEYVNIKKLGGRRKEVPETKNTLWRHPAFRGYADYMETPEFLDGIGELESFAVRKRTAMMCSEAVWWRCHRSMVSDYMEFYGWKVLHIVGAGIPKEHPFTEPAHVYKGKLTYHEIGKPLR